MPTQNSNINIKLNLQAKTTNNETSKLYKDFSLISAGSKQATSGITGLTKSLGLLNTGIKVLVATKVTQYFAGFVKTSMDAVESVNLFNVAMGDLAESSGEAATSLSKITGLDTVGILNNVGGYNLLARSMGVVSEKSQVLSTNTNNLAQDLASLTNRSFKDVSDDLRSGLVGQSETMYKYGVDVTEASLKQEALNQGITKSVRNMSQAEKMQLRYAVMIRQTALAQGDFANTINQPANQLRILQERLLTLSRSIGSIFMPALEAILPVLNALAILATEFANKIASAVGFVPEQIKNTQNNFSNLTGEVDSTEDSVDSLTKKVSKLAGFDQLNILGSKTDANNEDNQAVDIDVPAYDNKLSQITQKSTQIAEKIRQMMSEAFGDFDFGPLTQSFSRLKTSIARAFRGIGTITKEAYNNLVKPFFNNLLTDFIPRTNNIIAHTLDDLNFTRMTDTLNKLYESLRPVGNFVSESLLTFMDVILRPLAEWTFNDAIPTFFNGIANINNAIDWPNLTDKMKTLLEAFRELGKPIGQGLKLFFENVLVPFAVFIGNRIAPAMFDVIIGAVRGLTNFLEQNSGKITKFTEDVLMPLASFTAWAFVDTMKIILDVLGKLSTWIVENPGPTKVIIGLLGSLYATLKLFEGLAFLGTVFTKLEGPLASIGGVLSKLGPLFAGVFSSIGGVLARLGGVIASALAALLAGLAAFLGLPVWAAALIVAAVAATITAIVLFHDQIIAFMQNAWAGYWTWLGDFWSGVGNLIVGGIRGVVVVISALGATLKSWFENYILVLFTAEFWGNLAVNIGNAFYNGFKAAINGIVGLINFVIDFLNGALQFSWPSINMGGKQIIDAGNVQLAKIPNIPQLASGGILSAGQPFIAGEAGRELIGSYNNKTTVMPLENTSFVQAIKDAVKQGIQESSGNDQSIVVNVGGKTLVDEVIDGVNRKTRQTGKAVFNV